MAQSVFFDSQIVTRVSDGIIRETLWKEVIERLAGKYEYCVSFTTLMELVNALAGGDENHFQQDRNRLLVLTSPAKCRFLPMPGQFIRNTIFGLPLERPEYSPERLRQGWMPIIRRALNKQELSSGGVAMRSLAKGIDLTFGIDLGMLRKYMEDGKKLWGEELRLAKNGEKEMPPPELHATFILRFNVYALETQENVERLSRALDAAYCHLAQIHHASTRSVYRFDKNLQDWIDNQQLMYLADPELTFVTADKRLIAKLGKSKDRGRVREFTEFAKAI